MSEFRTRVNEFKSDLFKRGTFGVNEKRFTEGEDSLFDTGTRSLDHDPVVVNDTITSFFSLNGQFKRTVGNHPLG